MARRSAFRSGLVIFLLFSFRSVLSCLVLGTLLEVRNSVVSLFGGCGFGRFFLYPGPGGLQNRSLKYGFCCFFVSFLFVLCRFGRFGVQAWFVQIGFCCFCGIANP